jgi:hypothetical protein
MRIQKGERGRDWYRLTKSLLLLLLAVRTKTRLVIYTEHWFACDRMSTNPTTPPPPPPAVLHYTADAPPGYNGLFVAAAAGSAVAMTGGAMAALWQLKRYHVLQHQLNAAEGYVRVGASYDEYERKKVKIENDMLNQWYNPFKASTS